MADSEALRAALREAETAIVDTVRKTDHDSPGEKEPLEELQAAIALVTKVRQQLETGEWAGRNVATYPQSAERIFDGSR